MSRSRRARRGQSVSIVQDDRQERVIHLEAAVVLAEPELLELVHEEVHPRPCGANHPPGLLVTASEGRGETPRVNRTAPAARAPAPTAFRWS